MDAVEPPSFHVKAPPAPRLGTTAFRAGLAADHAAALRVAFVADPDGPFIAEATLRGQVAWRWFSLAAEVAGTGAASDRWSSAGLGNTVMDARFVFGRVPTQALGLRFTLASGSRDGPLGPVAWWGTVPAATVPTWGVALAWEGATERWTWHVHVGQGTDPWWAFAYFWQTWDLDAIVATVQPVAPGWAVVGELEVIEAQDPVHLRALARRELGEAWTVDAGLALPIPSLVTAPSVQILGQVRGAW